MELFTLHFLKEVFPTYKGQSHLDLTIDHVMTDSREMTANALFVPIIGDTFDGHDFIHQAIDNGAVAAIWSEKIEIPESIPETFVFFIVKDTIKGLQQLAKQYRNLINPTVIGITGSNGKTTTKDIVKSVLQTKRKTHATKGNFNNHIGLPLTILQMPKDTEVLVLEMGMNDFHEIDVLTNISQPNYAIITNIGESHIEHLGSREGILHAKLEIRNGLQRDGVLIIDGDEELLKPLKKEDNVITCGFEQANDVMITNVQLSEQETSFHIEKERYRVPLLGEHHAKNAAFAISIADQLQYQTEEIQKGLESLEHTDMRFEWLYGKNNVSIINDAYNASASSMKAAIQVVKQLAGFKRKGLVLGDILELGTYSKMMHKSVAEAIDSSIQYVFTYGDHAKEITDHLKETKPHITCQHYSTKEQLMESLQDYLQEDTLLLFKASRGMRFEEIIQEIME